MVSSWIQSISHNGSDTATMSTKDGNTYTVSCDSKTFDAWEGADSAGSYFNSELRGDATVTKV
jgi:hypothetical protein